MKQKVTVTRCSTVNGKPSWLIETAGRDATTADTPWSVIYGVCKALHFQVTLSECMAFARKIKERNEKEVSSP